jgi:hypothetical protein
MRYTYDCFKIEDGLTVRYDTFSKIDEIKEYHYAGTNYIKIIDNLSFNEVFRIIDQDSYEAWYTSAERASSWKPEKTLKDLIKNDLEKIAKDHINPTHYQAYISTEKDELQWIEAMQYLPHFRDPKVFLGALELQVRKYLDRSGGKDNEIQETKKALWYLKFMTAYMLNNYSPIRVKDINNLLK